MPLASTDVSILSRLLDAALDLTPAQFEQWLAALPPEHRHLLPRLRDMLACHAAGTTGFLSEGPRLHGAVDDTMAHAGDLVGPYRLIREIGHGGMGTVWLAERVDGLMRRTVALKLPRLAWGRGLAERMARERDIGALLEHPHIARLYDAGVDAKGRPFLALEYIDGVTIDEWCRVRSLDVRARLALFVQVIRAVAYAHGRLIVHRDLKPSNMLVTSDGQTHLLDFGIAKLLHDARPDADADDTRAQDRLLTPHYASPEQISGGTLTVAADVYGLGVVLYELLTGKRPYDVERAARGLVDRESVERDAPAASRRTDSPVVARTLRGEIDAVLAKALEHEPADRYATADAFAEDIERYLDGERVLARVDTVVYRMTKVLQRHRPEFFMAGVVLIAILGGAVISVLQARRASDAAERARVVKEFVVDVFKVNDAGAAANAELRELPAEVLLARGASLIQSKFPGQPALQAELYGVVAGIFHEMESFDLAITYATRQLEALSTYGAGDAENAKANLLLSQALSDAGRIGDAEVRARRALELASTDERLHLSAEVWLARLLRFEGRVDEAARLVAAAEEDLQHVPGPTAEGAAIKRMRALTLKRNNRFDEAQPIYRAAIDEALAAEGPLSRLAIESRIDLAGDLFEYRRPVEARVQLDAALAAMRSRGGQADLGAAREEAHFAVLMQEQSVISFAEAKATIERDRTLLMNRKVAPRPTLSELEWQLAMAYRIWGDYRSAARLADGFDAVDRWDVRDDTVLASQAAFEMALGHHARADELLRRQMLEDAGVGADGQKQPWTVWSYALRALNLSMAGDFAGAEAVLAGAPDTAPGVLPDQDVFRFLIARTRARVLLDRNDAQAALEALPAAENDDAEGDRDGIGYDYRLRGEILCRLGDTDQGLRLIEDTLRREATVHYEHHPALARGRAVAGLCALAAGQRQHAAALAALAHASLIAQPDVSEYFKRPSAELDRLLAASGVPRERSGARRATQRTGA